MSEASRRRAEKAQKTNSTLRRDASRRGKKLKRWKNKPVLLDRRATGRESRAR